MEAAFFLQTGDNPCIVINILDFNLIEENEHYHSIFDIRERRQGFQLVGDLEIHYLELKKLSNCLDAASLTTLEEWLIFIKDAANGEKRELIETIISKTGDGSLFDNTSSVW